MNVTVLDGKDSIITCRAVGAPTPNITWIFNGMMQSILDFGMLCLPKTNMPGCLCVRLSCIRCEFRVPYILPNSMIQIPFLWSIRAACKFLTRAICSFRMYVNRTQAATNVHVPMRPAP